MTTATTVVSQGAHTALSTGQDRLSGLPADILKHVLSFLTNKKDPFSWTLRQISQFEEEIYETLGRAQHLTTQVCQVLDISRVSRGIRSLLRPVRSLFGSTLVREMTALQDRKQGIECIEKCVKSISYLKLLKLFFTIKPQAVLNHAEDPKLNTSGRTVLHAACMTESTCPPAFINYILGLDCKHELGLMSRSDRTGKRFDEEGSQANDDYKNVLAPFVSQWRQALIKK